MINRIRNWIARRIYAQPTNPPTFGSIATRYSITHVIGQPQRLTLWGADFALTLDLPDETAKGMVASLTAGVIENRRREKKRA